jgi:ESF2/ABP1 family protein
LKTDAKRAYLRRKHTTTKKPHYTEGWVEFRDKKIARSVAEMLNAQPIGGKKGSRWRDDIWTMKYLPKFKWNMLTEQVGEFAFSLFCLSPWFPYSVPHSAHEAAIHSAKLRVELSQSRSEQQEYLKNVELARVLDKRAAKKREKGEELEMKPLERSRKRPADDGNDTERRKKKEKRVAPKEDTVPLDNVLSSIF